MSHTKWEVVIGLETHAQLSTRSKIFSRSSTRFGAEPNTQANAVDMALPGSLPAMNRGAVERAIRFGLAIGAPRQILGNLEYYFPFPGADKDKSLRLSAFVDAGMVDNTFNVGQLRFSTGFALNWFSPVGPLKLSFGIPIKKEPNDRLQRIQFQLGTIF